MILFVERYWKWTGGSNRYHDFKRSADPKGSEQLILLVEKEEKAEREKKERKETERRSGAAQILGGNRG